ncbi:helix-turn-helix transcriptional regulator [Caloramator sp. E03]|uniref:PadR family transcriptional regulator n=1 Tax=Caloramator sp. E03 TaxID=2576307 RepID=UPI0011102EB3|nr:PadR family transcriptional regulator [Caloramator sp. E03]QCX34348.1 helix-turn-helix transcriptional regulator [Caloramator sp. E03]
MENKILRKLFLGFIELHILHHAKKCPFYGSWMIEELKEHGYDISPGTLYPILHTLCSEGLLVVESKNVEGKIRKYYSITKEGEEILNKATEKAIELIKEIGG